MITLETHIQQYLCFCDGQKKLSALTLKAYTIDLRQFWEYQQYTAGKLDRVTISRYITQLHESYKPKSAKRKIACLKAFCSYLEYEELIIANPFSRIKIKFQEPLMLPRTISFEDIQRILKSAYDSLAIEDRSDHQKSTIIRDIAVLELLFATGVRVSELCSLKNENINLSENTVRIFGKGSKERIVQIENSEVLAALISYRKTVETGTKNCCYFFINRLGDRLSEQSVRFMVKKYAKRSGLTDKVTPHMFRHPYVKLKLKFFKIFLKVFYTQKSFMFHTISMWLSG